MNGRTSHSLRTRLEARGILNLVEAAAGGLLARGVDSFWLDNADQADESGELVASIDELWMVGHYGFHRHVIRRERAQDGTTRVTEMITSVPATRLRHVTQEAGTDNGQPAVSVMLEFDAGTSTIEGETVGNIELAARSTDDTSSDAPLTMDGAGRVTSQTRLTAIPVRDILRAVGDQSRINELVAFANAARSRFVLGA